MRNRARTMSDSSDQGKKFWKYFEKRFLKDETRKLWVLMYSNGCPSTNMSVENYHGMLKGLEYMGRKVNKRLDTLINHLKQYWEDSVFRRHQKLVKQQYNWKETGTLARHERGAAIPVSCITIVDARMMTIKGSDPESQYTVTIHERCVLPSCQQCRLCDLCTHAASCTCPDHNRDTICKHIHAGCVHFPHMFPFRRNLRERNAEELRCMNEVVRTTPRSDLEQLRLEAASLIATSSAMHPDDETVYLQKVIRSFNASTPSSASVSYRQPANLNVTPQRRPIKRRRLEYTIIISSDTTGQFPMQILLIDHLCYYNISPGSCKY